MAILHCKCGQSLAVPDHLAGRVGKCPKCGQKVRIPSSLGAGESGGAGAADNVPVVAPIRRDAGAGAGAAKSSGAVRSRRAAKPAAGTVRARYQARRAAGAGLWRKNFGPILAGAMILATIFIPWLAGRGMPGVGRVKVLMSWNMLGEMSGRDCSYLIGAWVVGAAAIAVSLCVRGLALRLSHLGMGLLGIILFWVAITGRGALFLRFRTILDVLPGKPGDAMQWWYWYLLVVAVMIAMGLRLRLGARIPVRVAVGVLVAGLAVWTAIRFFTTISDFSEMSKNQKEQQVLYLIAMLASLVAVITACVLALVDTASLRVDKKKLARGALYAIGGALGIVGFVFGVILPLHVTKSPGMILYMANSYLVIVGLFILFAAGAIGLTTLLVDMVDKRRQAGPAPAKADQPTGAAAPAGASASAPAAAPPTPSVDDLNTRLGKLKALLDKGAISQEEYDTERKRILADI